MKKDFCVYIGPSIRGALLFGAVLPGNRTAVLKNLEPTLEKYPNIKPLIIPGDRLPEALRDVKKPGTALHTLASKVLKPAPEKERNHD